MQSMMAGATCILFAFVVAGRAIHAQEMSSCCEKATGSCRTVCEKMSLVETAADATSHEDRLLNTYKFCQPELQEFWTCMNETLHATVGGRNWWGRECCMLSRGESCGRACASAADTRDTYAACRASDELALYQCVDRQQAAQECCSRTQSVECHEACRAALVVSGGSVRGARGRAAAACTPHSPRVIYCMRNLTRLAAAASPDTAPARYLSCCDHSTKPSCRESCLQILRAKTLNQDIVDRLQDGGCGPPLLHDAFWQCFLRKDSQAQQENEIGGINRMGIDSAKLHCCQKSSTSHCKRLCFDTFTKDWIDHWERFDAECLKQPQQAAMMQCVEEVDEPCELGCDGLSYCTNFNSRPTELFRSCNARADLAAHLDVANWQAQGYLGLPGLELPLRNTTQCSQQIWKAVACAVHIKPCSSQHSSAICREDCYQLVAQCLDWSRVSGDFTAASLCEKLSSDDPDTPCISLGNFMEPSPTGLVVQASMSPPRWQVTFPCKGSPCNTSQVCAVSSQCHGAGGVCASTPGADSAQCRTEGGACNKYTCTDGCPLGEASQLYVPRGTYVRIPMNNSQRVCLKICQCSDSGAIDNCQPLPCFSYDSCQLVNKNIPHGSQFYMECNLCTCYGGEVVCARRSCTDSSTAPGARARLPCQCAPHHLPVCATNGKTYPNTCLAKCAGLTDADIEFGACSLHDPCAGELGRCARNALCVPERAVCLSVMHAPCPQNVCVNISSCSSQPASPVCDTRGLTYPNACHLLASGHKLAYRGACLEGCQQKGRVCGIDGVTYDSECSAHADLVSVDYLGPCLAVGSVSDVVATKCDLDRIRCPALASPDCIGFTPPGACCPRCGGALRILYSRKQIDRALYAMRGNALYSLTLKSILKTLQRHIQAAECSVYGMLTIESEIFVSVESNVKNPSEIQLRTCISEAEKLSSLIKGQSARIISELSVSALSYSIEIHTFSTSYALKFSDNGSIIIVLVIAVFMYSFV